MDVVDWVVRTLVAFGVPGLIIYFVRDRRQKNAEDRIVEAHASVAEHDVLAHSRNTSVVSIESEIAAMQRTFEDDRKIKQATIDWLTMQLQAERNEAARREERHQEEISQLEDKVRTLQKALGSVSTQLETVTADLRRLKGDVAGK